MDKINHYVEWKNKGLFTDYYVAKMTFLGLATFPWKRLKNAKNTVKQRILQQKRSKIHVKFTKMQRNFNTYEKRP